MYIFKVTISYGLAIQYKIYHTIILFYMQYNISQTSLYALDNKITDHFRLCPELPKLIISFIMSVCLPTPFSGINSTPTWLIIWMDEFSDKNCAENTTFHVKYFLFENLAIYKTVTQQAESQTGHKMFLIIRHKEHWIFMPGN
jgi:hypothetical protein